MGTTAEAAAWCRRQLNAPLPKSGGSRRDGSPGHWCLFVFPHPKFSPFSYSLAAILLLVDWFIAIFTIVVVKDDLHIISLIQHETSESKLPHSLQPQQATTKLNE
jgi:hypothetical protein